MIVYSHQTISRVKESDKSIAYEEGHTTACYLDAQDVEGQGAFVGGACDPQDKVDQRQVVDTNLIFLVSNISFHGDQFEHAH